MGGGVIGASVAYHLAHLGCREVILLERKKLTSGTTWHTAGLTGRIRSSPNLTRLAKYTGELYNALYEETGLSTGYRRNGSVSIATTEERLEELKRGASMARMFGVEVVDEDFIAESYPIMNTRGVVGRLWIPQDGQLNPTDVIQALIKGARQRGAPVFEDTPVTRICHQDGRVTGVETAIGRVRAHRVVLCAGMWSRQLASEVGVNVPLHACEHFYIVTEAIDGLPPDLPVLRDPDACTYFKEDAGRLLVGAFEPVAKPWGMAGMPPEFSFDELPPDLDHFAPILEAALKRVPRGLAALLAMRLVEPKLVDQQRSLIASRVGRRAPKTLPSVTVLTAQRRSRRSVPPNRCVRDP